MKSGRCRNLRTGQMIGECVWEADTFWTRFRGLLGRKPLAPGEGLWIKPCRQVHMFGMTFPLSVWFLDESGRVCAIVDKLHPWGVSPLVKKAMSVIEFPEEWGKITGTQVGDILSWEEISQYTRLD